MNENETQAPSAEAAEAVARSQAAQAVRKEAVSRILWGNVAKAAAALGLVGTAGYIGYRQGLKKGRAECAAPEVQAS